MQVLKRSNEFGAQISFGPISWLMVGEVFPLAVRGQASALATLTNFASNFGVRAALPRSNPPVSVAGWTDFVPLAGSQLTASCLQTVSVPNYGVHGNFQKPWALALLAMVVGEP